MTPDPIHEAGSGSYLDTVIVAFGALASVLTSEKTVIALTVIFTALRIVVYVRDLWRRKP